MNKYVATAITAVAVALGASACSMKYVEFPVWEGPNEASTAKKPIPLQGHSVAGTGWSASYDKLNAKDVDGAIAALDNVSDKNYVYYAYLAVLYEVKHDWAKAEELMGKAIEQADGGSKGALEDELAYIKEHKAKYVSE